MKSSSKIVVFSIFLIWASLAFAGDNPFSGVLISMPESSYSPTITPEMAPVDENSPEIGTVDVNTSLNIRTSPWGDIVGSLSNNDKIELIGQEGDWYKIMHNGQQAYVHSAYVLREGEESKPFNRNGWVNSAIGLNVRRVPHGDVVGTIADQRGVQILGETGNYYKIRWGDDNEAFVDKRYVDHDMPSAAEEEIEEIDFTGYVTATALNVRHAPWGTIETTVNNGDAVKVTGKLDDWYRVEFNGKTRFVHTNYISDQLAPASSPAPSSRIAAAPSASSSFSSNRGRANSSSISRAARSLVGSTRFRGPEVNRGRLACAQVVSTALQNAGELDRTHLGVNATISDLRSKGWREVNTPPYQEGDVISWATYDRSGNGRNDPDTHIGIIVQEGNGFKAMHNSSRLRTPRVTDPYFGSPITRVLRKV